MAEKDLSEVIIKYCKDNGIFTEGKSVLAHLTYILNSHQYYMLKNRYLTKWELGLSTKKIDKLEKWGFYYKENMGP